VHFTTLWRGNAHNINRVDEWTHRLIDFDFSVLLDPDFKEDSVREEIHSPDHQGSWLPGEWQEPNCQKPRACTPFVTIGSTERKLTIIPDYLLYANDRPGWVLDAKSPSEAVDDPKHLAQVYSYAIHRDVRVAWYALCNGHEFALYHVADMSNTARVRFKIADICNYWAKLKEILVPLVIASYGLPYKKDFGIHLLQMGVSRDIILAL